MGLMNVDYYSLWSEVYKLSKTGAIDVIDAIKQSMSRFGVPDRIYSDNGPQFKAHKYRTFLKKNKITRKTSSPYRPQSNGLAEAMVKVVKSLIKKCHRSNQDLAMGLMNLRNSPIRGMASPAQILLGHQIQDNLPSVTNLWDQPVYSRDIDSERLKSKEQYDRHVPQQTLPTFQPNQQVAIQDTVTKEWSRRGRIEEETSPRSFIIELDNGKQIRRNRQLIRKVYQISLGNHTPVERERNEEIEAELLPEGGHVGVTVEDAADDAALEEIEDGTAETAGSDSDTEEYAQSGSEWDSEDSTIPYEDMNYMNADAEITVSRKGRLRKKHVPLDYDDL